MLNKEEKELNYEDYSRILEAIKIQIKLIEVEISEEKDIDKQIKLSNKIFKLSQIKLKIKEIIE
jgi:hypothetical protein